jgi:hypothetical protein
VRVLITAALVLALGNTSAVAKPRTVLESLRVPAPPKVEYIRGLPPGTTEAELSGNASSDGAAGKIYFQGILGRSTRAHELGHLLDHQVLTDGDRQYFQRLMHAPAGDWRSGTGLLGGLRSPSEWFADYYQASALGLDPTRQNEAAYATIGPKRLQRFEKALDRLTTRRGLGTYTDYPG